MTAALNGDHESHLQLLHGRKSDEVLPSTVPSLEEPDANAGIQPVPFFSLFRHGTATDLLIISTGMLFQACVGVSFAAMNLVFGQIIDDLATPSGSVLDTTSTMIRLMAALAGLFAILAFVGMSFIPYGAARITNRVREEYVKSVLRQDMAFFDEAKPGGIVASLSGYTLDFEEGISIKLGEGIQSCCGLVSGLAVALYFSWQITLMCFLAVPLLAFSFYLILQSGAGNDGILGKEAYEAAANIADETLSSMTTVASFVGETKAAKRYESHLGEAEVAAIRQGKKLGFGTGLLWGSFYVMMGLGFWWGGRLVISSTEQAMIDNPIPQDFYTNPEYNLNRLYAEQVCVYQPPGSFGRGEYVPYTDEAFEACVCGMPWSSVAASFDNSDHEMAVLAREMGFSGSDFVIMQCGCSAGELGSITSSCISAGRTIAVFFSVMIAGFMMAMIPPAFSSMRKAQLSAAKLYQVIDRHPDIDSASNKSRGKVLQYMEGRISIQNMHFQYPTSATKTFNNINLEIAAGETVALVGESGSGKSTIARLISRFYDPQEGSVCIDGYNLKDLNVKCFRDHIGIVSQEPLLFDDTIAKNIARGKAGPEHATMEEIVAAAKAANAYDFIQTFPEGFETKVGARGGKLSGGQKQRIAIARALIRKPSILILDEATSALDNESEKVVQSAIDNLVGKSGSGGGITTIIIAHRLSTIRNADRIVVLGSQDGTSTANGSTIVEVGSHYELMNKDNGLYKALVGTAVEDNNKGNVGTSIGDSSAVHAISTTPSIYSSEVETSFVDDTEEKKSDTYASIGSTVRVTANGSTIVEVSSQNELRKKDASTNASIIVKEADDLDVPGQNDKAISNDFNKIDKKRLGAYSQPERLHFIIGLFACFCTGLAFPTCGMLFSLMLSAMANFDTDVASSWIRLLAGTFGLLAFFMIIAQFFQTYLFEIIGERMTKRIRTDYFRALLRQNIGWFDLPQNALGVLTSRLAVDIKLIRLCVGQGTGATVSSMTSLLVGFVVSMIAAWQFALAFLATVPLLALTEMINWALMKGGDSTSKKKLGEISGLFGEYVQGIREVQSFSLEMVVTSEVGKMLQKDILDVSKKAAFLRGVSAGSVQVIQLGVYALAFYIGATLIDNGLLDYESFNLVLWSMAFGASGMGQAANWVASAAKGKAAAVRVFELLDRVPPIDSKPWKEDGSPREIVVPTEVGNIGEIEFRNVKFAYPTRKTARVFDGMSLRIPAGQTAALIGSSGSGKSTVMALLERFYDPVAAVVDRGNEELEIVVEDTTSSRLDKSNGVVYVDGIDIRKMDVMYLRSEIGLVGQEPVLFDASVAENIKFGKDGATEEEIIAAAKVANAHEFISRLDGGYNYNVGTRGKKVSGGQKQRIAIARAVLKNPRILLLDEATSALDNESEKIVQESIDSLVADNKSHHRTTIIIAHRLSTVRNADCIYVLENSGDGAFVVESGNHEELIALGGKYKALLQATIKSED